MVYKFDIPKMMSSHGQVRFLTSLAFETSNNVISYFEKLVNSTYFVENENIVSTLLDYFEDT